MSILYILLLVAILISILTGLGIYITIKNKKKTLYSCSNNTCIEDINGKYNSLNDCENDCKKQYNPDKSPSKHKPFTPQPGPQPAPQPQPFTPQPGLQPRPQLRLQPRPQPNIPSPITKMYSCVDRNCVENPNGQYTTSDCNNECVSSQKWFCDINNDYTCTQGPSGIYDNEDDCYIKGCYKPWTDSEKLELKTFITNLLPNIINKIIPDDVNISEDIINNIVYNDLTNITSPTHKWYDGVYGFGSIKNIDFYNISTLPTEEQINALLFIFTSIIRNTTQFNLTVDNVSKIFSIYTTITSEKIDIFCLQKCLNEANSKNDFINYFSIMLYLYYKKILPDMNVDTDNQVILKSIQEWLYYCGSTCPLDITNEKFGSFSIGAALKTPIIYNYGNVQYEGVA